MKLIGMFLGITVAYVTSAPPGKPIPYFAGPFRIVVRKMHNKSIEYTTTGEMWGDVRFTHFRHGQLQWFWGTVRHSVPWDDSLTGIIYVSQWSNNQWKPNAFRLKFSNVCSAALLHAKDLMVLIHGEEGARCPIREGTWQIPNKSLDFVFSKFPIFPYGRWLGTGVLSQGTTNLGLMTVEVDIIPQSAELMQPLNRICTKEVRFDPQTLSLVPSETCPAVKASCAIRRDDSCVTLPDRLLYDPDAAKNRLEWSRKIALMDGSACVG